MMAYPIEVMQPRFSSSRFRNTAKSGRNAPDLVTGIGRNLQAAFWRLRCLRLRANSNSIAKITKNMCILIKEITQRKQTPVLVIDKANLPRLEVLVQLQILLQFDYDSKPLLPLIRSGQNNLLDKVMYHTSQPIASHMVARSHLEDLDHTQMVGYLKHHKEIVGVKNHLFADEAILAIHQGSGGLLRRANNLARGALIAAAKEQGKIVSAEYVRISSTEAIGFR